MSNDTKDINITVNTGDTVPLHMYERLEHSNRHLANNLQAQKRELEQIKFNITSLLRELSSDSDIDQIFLVYLQEKYGLINIKEEKPHA